MSDSSYSSPPSPAPVPPLVPPQKKGMSTGCIIGLIVGIVGLVALVVIALIMAIAVPFGRGVLEKARKLQVQAQLKGLEMAIKGYQTEYNRLPSTPSPPPTADNSPGFDTTAAEGKAIIQIITAADTLRNPRGISFYEPPPVHKSGGGYTAAGGLIDIWGAKGYIIILDYDGDGRVPDPEHPGALLSERIIIYSAGPDGDFSTWKDNVKSWKP
jgi:type II secretory pathway pseudopilin PulG